MRLTEQAKVLKEEIRRQERNQQRENAISNMEYLKNVIFKVSVMQFFFKLSFNVPISKMKKIFLFLLIFIFLNRFFFSQFLVQIYNIHVTYASIC